MDHHLVSRGCVVMSVVVMVTIIGPAGTGKTESVKALGHQLGRFVLVFNCDERFDFQVREGGEMYHMLFCYMYVY